MDTNKSVKTLLPLISMLLFATASNANTADKELMEMQQKNEFQQEIKKTLESKGAVEGMQRLPIRSMQFVYTNEGESYAVSENARFVFVGKMIDLWQQKEIKTLADAINTSRVPLEVIGYNSEDLSTMNIGNPDIEQQGVIFVSPNCQYCQRLLSHIDDNKEKYNFEIVITPVLKGSAAESRRLFCAVDKEKALKSLISHNKDELIQDPDCNWKRVIDAGMMFNRIEGKGVPLLFRSDGLRKEGIHPQKKIEEQLTNFLNRS